MGFSRIVRHVPRGLNGKLLAAPSSRALHQFTTVRQVSRAGFARREYIRTYATSQQGKTTATTSSKKTAAKPAKKATKTAAKKPGKKPAKKPAKKPLKKEAKKPAKKILSPEAKQRALIKRLKEAALLSEPKSEPWTGYTVFLTESMREIKGSGPSSGSPVTGHAKRIAEQWNSLSSGEKSRYGGVASENSKRNEQKRHEWINSFTPDQVRLANNARKRLNYLYKQAKADGKPIRGVRQYRVLSDTRVAPRPASAYVMFFQQKMKSGDLSGMRVQDAVREAGRQWKALSNEESQPFHDASRIAREAWEVQAHALFPSQVRKPADSS